MQKFVQAKETSIHVGVTSTEVSEITLKRLVDIYGTQLTMEDFGDSIILTINPGSETNEEIILATDFTVNSDGTVTLDTGLVRMCLAKSPYSASAITPYNHSAGDRVIIGNNPQLYAAIYAYIDGIAIAGAPNASATTKGLTEEATTTEINDETAEGSTGARLFVNPETLGDSKYGLQLPTASQKAGLAGDATPSATNPFTTRNRTMKAGETIAVATTPVPLYQNKTDNEFYICDGNDTGKLKFLGFGITSAGDGEDIEVQFSGIVSGFTGLAEGEKYYLSDTAGAISTTIGTYEVLVGIAISETQLLIQKGARTFTGDGETGTSASYVDITCGFRLKTLRVFAVSFSTDAISAHSMVYTNGVWKNAGVRGASTGSFAAKSSGLYPYLQTPNAGSVAYFYFYVDNITDTGFRLGWSEEGSATNIQYMFEALGEL